MCRNILRLISGIFGIYFVALFYLLLSLSLLFPSKEQLQLPNDEKKIKKYILKKSGIYGYTVRIGIVAIYATFITAIIAHE